MADVNIRQLQGRDIKKLQTLYSRHLYRHGAYQVRLSITEPNAWAKTVCKRLYLEYIFNKPLDVLGLETFVCAIAEANSGEIVGTVVARRQHPLAKTWKLGLVVVQTQYRGLGISTRMMNFIFKRLEARKAKELTLIVNTHSTAKRLYEKVGFKSLEQLYVAYGRLLLPLRRTTDIRIKKIFTRTPNEDFISFCFKRGVNVFLSIFFRESLHIDTLAVFMKNRLIGFLKVDNSKFSGTGVVEEIDLHPDFQNKSVIKEVLEAFFEVLKSMGVKNVVFQVVRTPIDRVFLREILLELNLKRVTTYSIMSKKW